MRKKTLAAIVVIIVIALLAGFVGPVIFKGQNDDAEGNTNEAVSTSSEAADETVHASGTPSSERDDSTDEAGTEQGAGGNSPDNYRETDDPASHDENNGNSGSGSSSGGSSKDNDNKSGSDKKDGDEGKSNIPTISFPYKISGTDLVIEQVRSFKGYFIEDGSDQEVSDVAAIVVTNNGDALEFAGIGISQGTRSLAFSASQIPAGAKVIILEQTKASYSSDPYYSATATTKPVDGFEMSEKLVSVKDNGNDFLTVTNISGKKLSGIKIHFKNYLPEEKVYVGGITYTISLTDIEPDESIDVSASHYDSRYSRVMEIHAE